MRTLVVGDIHGGLRALVQVFERVEIRPKDRIIFVGDYVDGWSEAAETVRFLLELSTTHSCVFLRGNHEELLYNYLSGKENNPMWLNHGGVASIQSYNRLSEEERKQHIMFFKGLENYFIDEENRCYVHAGYTNLRGPKYEYFPNMVYWDRTLWELVCGLDKHLSESDLNYPERLKIFKEIYIGHTPVTRIGKSNPTIFANVWNVDTGAAFKGKLSVIDVNTKEFWQSDPVWELYPDEKGRN